MVSYNVSFSIVKPDVTVLILVVVEDGLVLVVLILQLVLLTVLILVVVEDGLVHQ